MASPAHCPGVAGQGETGDKLHTQKTMVSYRKADTCPYGKQGLGDTETDGNNMTQSMNSTRELEERQMELHEN